MKRLCFFVLLSMVLFTCKKEEFVPTLPPCDPSMENFGSLVVSNETPDGFDIYIDHDFLGSVGANSERNFNQVTGGTGMLFEAVERNTSTPGTFEDLNFKIETCTQNFVRLKY